MVEFAMDLLNRDRLAGAHLLSVIVSRPEGLARLQSLVCGGAAPLELNFVGVLLHGLERGDLPAADAGAILALLAAALAGGAVPIGTHGRDILVLGALKGAARYPSDRRCAAALCRALAGVGVGCTAALAMALRDADAQRAVLAALRAPRLRRDGHVYVLGCGALTALARWGPFCATAFASHAVTADVVDSVVSGAWLSRGSPECIEAAVLALDALVGAAPAVVHATVHDTALALPLVAMTAPRGSLPQLDAVLNAMRLFGDLLAGSAHGAETLRALTPLVPWSGVLRDAPGNDHALILTGSLIATLEGITGASGGGGGGDGDRGRSLASFVGFGEFVAAFTASSVASGGTLAGVMVLWGQYVIARDGGAIAAAVATPALAEAWVCAIVRHIAYVEPNSQHDADKVKHGVAAARRAAELSADVRAALCGRGGALGRGGGDEDRDKHGFFGKDGDGAAGPIVASALRHRRDPAIVDGVMLLARTLTTRWSDDPSSAVESTATFSVRSGAVAAFADVAGAALLAGLLGDGPPPPPSVLSADAMECLLFAATRCAESAPEVMARDRLPYAVLRLIESRAGAVADTYGPAFFAAIADCEEGRAAVARMRSRLGALADRSRGARKDAAAKGAADAYDAVIVSVKGGGSAPLKRVIYM